MAKVNICDACVIDRKMVPAKYRASRRVSGIKYDACIAHRKAWANKTDAELLDLIQKADTSLNILAGLIGDSVDASKGVPS